MYAVFMSEPINTAERATVKKSLRGARALDEVMQATGENVTDAYNQAMIIYARLLRETARREPEAQPGEIIVYFTDPEDRGSTEKVYLT